MPGRKSPYVPHCPADASKKTPQPFRRGEVGGMDMGPAFPTLLPRKVIRENSLSGRSPGFRLRTYSSRLPGESPPSGLVANFVTGYSCGAAMELHHLPDTRDRAPDGNFLILVRLCSLRFCGVSTVRVPGGSSPPGAEFRLLQCVRETM